MNSRTTAKRYTEVNKSQKQKIISDILNSFYKKKSSYWMDENKKMVVRLYNWTKTHVPAYVMYLKAQGFSKRTVKHYNDLDVLPSTSKSGYLQKFPLESLCNGGKSGMNPEVFAVTSGSTGKPFYFPRDLTVDFHSSVYHEFFFKNAGIKAKERTLIIIGFGMGVWIGGIITYEAIKKLVERGYNISIITPGANKYEIYTAIKNIGHLYDNIVLTGYPPFLKDLIDEAGSMGIDWKKLPPIKVIFAAEMFSEKFRDHIAKKLFLKNIYRDTTNIYGTADLGTMAHETPLSIFIRRLAISDTNVYKKLFLDASRLPTLAQFNPSFVSFEARDRSVAITGHSALPLVRYDIGDNGGVISFDDIKTIFQEEGIDLISELKKAELFHDMTQLPFVYIYERSDLSTKLYGAIIYPEHIRDALQEDVLDEYLTGRFTLITKHDGHENEYLEINLELDGGKNASEKLKIEAKRLIVEMLIKKNAEYAYLTQNMPERVQPVIVFWPHEHPTHFGTKGKQKWVKKETL